MFINRLNPLNINFRTQEIGDSACANKKTRLLTGTGISVRQFDVAVTSYQPDVILVGCTGAPVA